MKRLLFPLVTFLLLLSTGCFLLEERGESEAGPAAEEPTAEAAAAEDPATEPAESAAGNAEDPATDAADTEAPAQAAGDTGLRGEGAEPAGEAEPDAQPAAGPGGESGGEATLADPAETLRGFPEQPRRPRDARIGRLTGSRLEESARARAVSRAGEQFFADLFGEDPEIHASFYDPYFGEQLVDRIQDECSGVRTGVPELLPQDEWLLPFRCLNDGEPIPLFGELYLRYEESPIVVDGSVEAGEAYEDFAPGEIEESTVPF